MDARAKKKKVIDSNNAVELQPNPKHSTNGTYSTYFSSSFEKQNSMAWDFLIEIDRHKAECDEVTFVNELPSNGAASIRFSDHILKDDALEMILSEYNQTTGIMKTDAVVRPWKGASDCVQENRSDTPIPYINVFTQSALFKCMVAKCFYSTDREERFGTHMQVHLDVIEHFREKKFRTTNPLDKSTRKSLTKFRECAYCDFKTVRNELLTEHMETVHRRCIFQCEYCFYRTVEADNVVRHQKSFHTSAESSIFLCRGRRKFEEI